MGLYAQRGECCVGGRGSHPATCGASCPPHPPLAPQLIETTGAALEGRRILMYSYGSGTSASMFSLVGRVPGAPRFHLARLQAMVSAAGAQRQGQAAWRGTCWAGRAASDRRAAVQALPPTAPSPATRVQSDLAMRLARRVPKSPAEFEQAMQLAEQRYCAGNYRPEMPAVAELEPGTYHLVEVDARYRRVYARHQ